MSLGTSVIVDKGRALMAAMQPLTGGRASGMVRMRAQPGSVITLPKYFYFMAVLDGQLHTAYLYKLAAGPNEDESWTIDDSGTTQVMLFSNVGGQRFNIDDGTIFNPDIPIEGLIIQGADAPIAVGDFEGGTEPGEFCGVRSMVLFDSFDGPDITLDLHRAGLSAFPGVMVAFDTMEPADGVAIATNDQSAVNAGDGKKFYKINYSIAVLSERTEGDASRRQEGLLIADTITQLLNDKKAGDPGEDLSNPGGVQIRQVVRESGAQNIYKKFYIYTILVSVMTSLVRLDFRTFQPWLRAVMNVDVPQIPALPDQGTFRLVDGVEIDMTPDTLDLALDGTFIRGTASNLYVPESVKFDAPQLLPFAIGVRRVSPTPAFGTFMEPAISNDVGAAAEDLTLWTTDAGAVVASNVENDPLGNLTADRIDFIADADSLIEFTGPIVPSGVPVVFYVFAKAPGTKFTTAMRLVAEDAGAAVSISDDIAVGNVWTRYRFEFTPATAGVVTFRIQNSSDAELRSVMAWGVFYSDASRWGPEYTAVGAPKDKDQLTFTPGPIAGQQANLVTPPQLLSGRWRLRFTTPSEIPPDVLGAAVGAPVRTLVSVGDGATELITLRLVGTPASGGAAFELVTRGDGSVINLAGVEWAPGAELQFTVDAIGTLQIEGTSEHDATYTFPRYVEDAVPGDFLVIGDESTGTTSPTPGSYTAIDVDV